MSTDALVITLSVLAIVMSLASTGLAIANGRRSRRATAIIVHHHSPGELAPEAVMRAMRDLERRGDQ